MRARGASPSRVPPEPYHRDAREGREWSVEPRLPHNWWGGGSGNARDGYGRGGGGHGREGKGYGGPPGGGAGGCWQPMDTSVTESPGERPWGRSSSWSERPSPHQHLPQRSFSHEQRPRYDHTAAPPLHRGNSAGVRGAGGATADEPPPPPPQSFAQSPKVHTPQQFHAQPPRAPLGDTPVPQEGARPAVHPLRSAQPAEAAYAQQAAADGGESPRLPGGARPCMPYAIATQSTPNAYGSQSHGSSPCVNAAGKQAGQAVTPSCPRSTAEPHCASRQSSNGTPSASPRVAQPGSWEESVRAYIHTPLPKTERDNLEAAVSRAAMEFSMLRSAAVEQRTKCWAIEDKFLRLLRDFERRGIMVQSLTRTREFLEKNGVLPEPSTA